MLKISRSQEALQRAGTIAPKPQRTQRKNLGSGLKEQHFPSLHHYEHYEKALHADSEIREKDIAFRTLKAAVAQPDLYRSANEKPCNP